MKNKFYILVLSLLMILPTFAQVDRSIRPQPGKAPEIKIGDYKSFELPNGLKVYVVENKKLPKIAINVVFDRDPMLEGDFVGLAEITGQMLSRGTTKRTKEQIDQEVDFIGASLSTSSYSIFSSGLSKYSDKIMELTADVILNPTFKQEELDKVKKQTISGILSSKDNPSQIASIVKNKIIFGAEHPYGEITSEESVNKVSVEKLKEFYNNSFAPNIAYMAIVGDITKAQAEKLVKKYFTKWQKKEIKKVEYKTPKNPLVNRVSIIDRPVSVQSVLNVSYPIDLKVGSEDAIAVSVLNQILGGSATSRLFMNLREKHGFTYGAYSNMSADNIVGSFNASCEVRNVATDSAATEIIKEMEKLVNEKISEEELQAVKNYLSGSFARSLENPSTISRFALNIARYNLPKDYYATYLKKLNSLTADDIQNVAKKYLKPSRVHIVVCGNGDEIEAGLKKFSPSGKVYYYDTDGKEFDPASKKIPAGLTYKQVMDRNIEVTGGKEKMLAVKDLTMVMTGEVQGMNITITRVQKAPNKMFMEVDFGMGKQIVVFDGQRGKTSMMGQEQEMEGESLESMKVQADIHSSVNYEKSSLKYELSGIEKVNGNDAYKVTTIISDKSKSINYFDIASGLLVKTVTIVDTPQGPQSTTVGYGDYRDVEGVKYPFIMNTQTGPMTIEMKATKIEINKGVDDSLFIIK